MTKRAIKILLPLAVLVSLNSCVQLLIKPSKPASIEAFTATSQFGYAGESSDEPIIVRVLDSENIPMKNVTVKFSLTDGTANITAQAKTDAAGVAHTEVQFSSTPGNVVVEASADGLDTKITYIFLVSASRTSKVTIVSGNGQEVKAGTQVPMKLSVKVSDDYDQPAADVTVSFTVVAGDGTVASPTVKTNSAGIAESDFIASSNVAINTVEAAVGTNKVAFSIASIFPVEILSAITETTGMKIIWTPDINGAAVFDRYILYKRVSGNGVFQSVATINLPGDTQLEDDDVEFGSNYDYKVVIMTKKGYAAESSVMTNMYGHQVILEEQAADFEIDEERKLLYVSIPAKNKIAIYGLDEYDLKSTLQVGSKPTGMSLSHDNETLYVALNGSGHVALVDLDTKQFSLVDVEEAVGDPRIFDVVEGAPGKLFVSGNPQSNGVAYISVIHLDQGNQVERFFPQVVRFDPVLQADYGVAVYILNEQNMYKIDPFETYTEDFYEADQGFTNRQQEMVISPDRTRLYLNFGVLKSADLMAEHTFVTNGMPAIDSNGSNIYVLINGKVRVYNAQNYTVVREIPHHLTGYLGRMKLRADNSQILVYSFDYTRHTLSIIPNPQ